jgi:hypothetical protein
MYIRGNVMASDYKKLSKELMELALTKLEEKLTKPLLLIIGGGGAMVLAYEFPLATTDLDGIAKGFDLTEIEKEIKSVAAQLGITPDWLNPYFSAYTHVLPPDYNKRMRTVFSKKNLQALALGPEDLLIMKCFARRAKDMGHIRTLLKQNPDLDLVTTHLETLITKKIKGAQEALDFLDEFLDEESAK